ncbi:hypothetical protein JZ751_004110, partial [Albula glossodonta]
MITLVFILGDVPLGVLAFALWDSTIQACVYRALSGPPSRSEPVSAHLEYPGFLRLFGAPGGEWGQAFEKRELCRRWRGGGGRGNAAKDAQREPRSLWRLEERG